MNISPKKHSKWVDQWYERDSAREVRRCCRVPREARCENGAAKIPEKYSELLQELGFIDMGDRMRNARIREWIEQSPLPKQCEPHKAWSRACSSACDYSDSEPSNLSASDTQIWDSLPLSVSMRGTMHDLERIHTESIACIQKEASEARATADAIHLHNLTMKEVQENEASRQQNAAEEDEEHKSAHTTYRENYPSAPTDKITSIPSRQMCAWHAVDANGKALGNAAPVIEGLQACSSRTTSVSMASDYKDNKRFVDESTDDILSGFREGFIALVSVVRDGEQRGRMPRQRAEESRPLSRSKGVGKVDNSRVSSTICASLTGGPNLPTSPTAPLIIPKALKASPPTCNVEGHFSIKHVSTSGHSSSPPTPRPPQTPAPPSLKHSADPMNTYFASTTNYHTIDDLQFDDTDDLQYDDIPEIPLPPSNSVPTLAPYSPEKCIDNNVLKKYLSKDMIDMIEQRRYASNKIPDTEVYSHTAAAEAEWSVCGQNDAVERREESHTATAKADGSVCAHNDAEKHRGASSSIKGLQVFTTQTSDVRSHEDKVEEDLETEERKVGCSGSWSFNRTVVGGLVGAISPWSTSNRRGTSGCRQNLQDMGEEITPNWIQKYDGAVQSVPCFVSQPLAPLSKASNGRPVTVMTESGGLKTGMSGHLVFGPPPPSPLTSNTSQQSWPPSSGVATISRSSFSQTGPAVPSTQHVASLWAPTGSIFGRNYVTTSSG